MGNQSSVSPQEDIDRVASPKIGQKPVNLSSNEGVTGGDSNEELNPVQILFQFIPYYGQGNTSNDSYVRGTLAALSMEEIDTPDEYGNTLLLLACQYAAEDLVRIMLKKGANPNAINNEGACCLHFACYEKSASKGVAQVLLSNGAMPEVVENSHGCTPLHYCAGVGDVEFIKMLITHGANVETRDFYNFTCEDYAREANCNAAAAFLHEKLATIQDGRAAGLMSPGGKKGLSRGNSFNFASPIPHNLVPNDWQAHVDPATGATYYVNQYTHETLWEADLKVRIDTSSSAAPFGGASSTYNSPQDFASHPPSTSSNMNINTNNGPNNGNNMPTSLGDTANAQVQKHFGNWANKATARVRLIALLGRHDPTRLLQVDSLLEEYADKEDEMFSKLVKEYKVEDDPEFADLVKKPEEATKTPNESSDPSDVLGDLLGGSDTGMGVTPKMNVPSSGPGAGAIGGPPAGAPGVPGSPMIGMTANGLAMTPSGLPQIPMISDANNTAVVKEAQKKYDAELESTQEENKKTITMKDSELKELQDKVDLLSLERMELDSKREDLSNKVEQAQLSEESGLQSKEAEASQLQTDNTEMKAAIGRMTDESSAQTEKLSSLEDSLKGLTSNSTEREAMEKKMEEDRIAKEKEREERHTAQLAEVDINGKAYIERIKKEIERVQTEREKSAADAVIQLEELKSRKENEITQLEEQLKEYTTKTDTEMKEVREAITLAKETTEIAIKETTTAQEELEGLQEEAISARVVMQTNTQLHKDLQREQQARRRLHNELEDMRGKMRIMVRLRPLSDEEVTRGCKEVVSKDGKMSALIRTTDAKKIFDFDHVFGGSDKADKNSQSDVFDEVKNLIVNVVDGFTVSFLTLGHTGAGKTHTLIGALSGGGIIGLVKNNEPERSAGLGTRAIVELFRLLEERHAATRYQVSISMLQLYQNGMQDLLWSSDNNKGPEENNANAPPELAIRLPEDSDGLVCVDGLEEREATDVKSTLNILQEGAMRMKADPARAHLVVRITISCTNRRSGLTTMGRLALVDMAGNERLGTGSPEEQSIKASLDAVGNVISALGSLSDRIPYTAHPLPALLSDCMSPQSKCVMMVCASAADESVQHSHATLQFAAKCKDVGGGIAPAVQAQQLNNLKKELAKLKKVGNTNKKAGLGRPS